MDATDTATMPEARRALEICNACRYCEGFCAVFPAMERRRAFPAADLGFLANLCHGCNGCYHACQYAPPHEWAVNLPASLSRVRRESWSETIRPAFLRALLRRPWAAVAGAVAAALIVVLASVNGDGRAHVGPGAFYEVIPLSTLIALGSVAFLFALLAMVASTLAAWRGLGGVPRPIHVLRGLHDAATLKNLGGGGEGCPYPNEKPSRARRHLHHALAGGFLLAFAATCVATVYEHVLGWHAPYPLLSVPVLLGTAGGVLMLVGAAGLLDLKRMADPAPLAAETLPADRVLLWLLGAIAASGLLLLALRATVAMPLLLAIHLALVLGFFVTMPFGKFLHAPHRLAALVRDAMERDSTHA
jgi:citrate/tricarballylate utilization protein